MRLLKKVVQQERAERYQQRIDEAPVPESEALPRLPKWIPIVTTSYSEPRHLAPLTDDIERISAGQRVDAVYAAPPLHGKSETVGHSIPWVLKQHPAWRIGYLSYVEDQAAETSRRARDIAKQVGLKLVRDGATDWETEEGGGVFAAGWEGAWTGKHFHWLIIDDPHKDMASVSSSAIREKLWSQCEYLIDTRLFPGASTTVIGARWSTDDIQARLSARRNWPYKRMPAIIEDERGRRPLWPEVWSLDRLDEKAAANAWRWAALYLGLPRPLGGALFGDAKVFTQLPTEYRVAIGIDCAYTKKKTSDWSVALVMLESEERFYVVDVIRRQLKSPEFKQVLRGVTAAWPSAQMRWYRNTVEEGVADFIAAPDPDPEDPTNTKPGIPLDAILAREDKVVRAQPFATGWNAGKVLVPAKAPWLDDFLIEIGNFTGVNDEHDDQVDAGAAAYDTLFTGGPMPAIPGTPTEAALLRRAGM